MDGQNVFPKFNKNNLKLHKSRGISSIFGGLIFLVLLTSGFSAFYMAMDVQRDTVYAQRDLSGSIIEKTQEKFEIAVSTDSNDNNRLGIQVKNQGQNPVEISNIWIINKSATETPPYSAVSYDVNYDDAFIPPGYGAPILEKTPLYMSPGEYDIKVVSVLGTIVTEKEFDPNNPGFGGIGESTGDIFMEFTSFEFCEPAVDDCTSVSSDWITAWDGKMITKYLWRINIANRGAEDIMLEQTTSLFMLHAQTKGGGNLPRTFFIKADSTITVEDPGAYIDNSKIIPKNGTAVTVYFGVEDNGSSILQETHDTPGINAVFLLIFGHQDVNENQIYDNPVDPPYSQNLAFQGLRLIENNRQVNPGR